MRSDELYSRWSRRAVLPGKQARASSRLATTVLKILHCVCFNNSSHSQVGGGLSGGGSVVGERA